MTNGERSILDDILPEYESIIRAPKIDELQRRADARCVDIEHVMEEERKVRYKALDSYTGSVFLVQNPSVWLFVGNGYLRPPPEYQFKLNDAKKFSGGGMGKKVGSARESF